MEPYLSLDLGGAVANLGVGVYGGPGFGLEFPLPADFYFFGESGLNTVLLIGGESPVIGAELLARGGVGYRF